MLNKVPKFNYETCYPTRLKRLFRSNINYKTYDSFVPNVKNAIVGNLPPEVISLFKSDKGRNIKSFQKSLSNITNYLRACYKKMKQDNIISHGFEDLAEDLPVFENMVSNVATKCLNDILPKDTYAEIKYINRGSWGNVFKFSLKDTNGNTVMKSKAFKVYHNIHSQKNLLSHIHNNYAEANFWTFLKYAAGHKLDKTQFVKHYISDLKSGYAITEYIDESIPKTTSRLNIRALLGVRTKDPNVPIMDKLYDAGGFAKTPDFIDDKVVRRYFKKLWYRNSSKERTQVIEDLENKISNPKTPHRDKIKKALELFKQKQNKYYQII